ncbi:succinoglycan biosynthesis glycosyltransferase ExoA [Isoptericola halotolerans]|uniref:GT2 family glycosyltransferase n=1 Tax=Isoptericola halotolerans TaxID=300560 RepID=A0ABX2A3X7_9MICO|nr:glycosyltransferase family 2 protein [Isoptericola halotolerans]NOV97570.1 GT2 family glycosyltransferase [Isoptericola halotolerans]
MAEPLDAGALRLVGDLPVDCGVTVVACVRDEEAYLAAAVRSVLAQDHDGDLRLVLAVGPSHDATAAIAERLAEDERVTVVDNPTGSRSIGLNLAIEHGARDQASAEHAVVVRVDGHTELPPDYVRRCVELLRTTGAVGVGGMMTPVGHGTVQEAAARAMSHPAGIGAVQFHTGGRAGEAETVYLGAFRRAAVQAVGGYDPTLFRAEDWDLCLRLRRAGGLLWFDPSLVVEYRPRRTLRAVAKQFWRTGMWRREVVRRDPSTAGLRYLAPPLLVLALGLSVLLVVCGAAVGSSFVLVAGLAVPVGYVVGVLGAAVHAASRRPALRGQAAVVLPVVLVVMHVCWGCGFVRGLTARAAADHRA